VWFQLPILFFYPVQSVKVSKFTTFKGWFRSKPPTSSESSLTNPNLKVFGTTLQLAVDACPSPVDKTIPAVLYRCIQYLEASQGATLANFSL
jgi:hypothetical protein